MRVGQRLHQPAGGRTQCRPGSVHSSLPKFYLIQIIVGILIKTECIYKQNAVYTKLVAIISNSILVTNPIIIIMNAWYLVRVSREPVDTGMHIKSESHYFNQQLHVVKSENWSSNLLLSDRIHSPPSYCHLLHSCFLENSCILTSQLFQFATECLRKDP